MSDAPRNGTELMRRGRSLCSVEAEARTPDGVMVAKALVSSKLG